jgi:UPF0716 protein FxsA
MRGRVLPVILALILAEIAVFILVGEAIGLLPTLALTALGMVAGGLLLRWSGVATLLRIRAEAEAGQLPARPLLDGAVSAIAALLIMLPGFISDAIGLFLLLPFAREAAWRRWRQSVVARAATDPALSRGGRVIELERRDYSASPRRDSPWRHDG